MTWAGHVEIMDANNNYTKDGIIASGEDKDEEGGRCTSHLACLHQ